MNVKYGSAFMAYLPDEALALKQGADLRTAVNFSIDPATNRIAKAKFSTHNIAGLLHTYNIIIE
jgi:hypothetical protein